MDAFETRIFQPAAAGLSATGTDLTFGEAHESSVVIPKALFSQLWDDANEGSRMLARRGLEIGGLLVGPRAAGPKAACRQTVVDSIIPLPIEYQYGPAFQLSPSDLAGIAAAILAVQQDRSKVVVGFYRSRTRGEDTFRESDHQVLGAIASAHSSFVEDFRCCLVLAPVSDAEALACIALRHGHGWREMQPVRIRANPLAIVETCIPSAAEPIPAEADAHEKENPGARPIAQRSGARRVKALYALVAFAGAASGYRCSVTRSATHSDLPRVEAGAPTHLGFSAGREGTVWRLSWDRASIDALRPAGGVVSIEDGGYQQQVPLAPADLASGALFYVPNTSNLSFSMRIDQGEEHFEEHVRVLAAVATP